VLQIVAGQPRTGRIKDRTPQKVKSLKEVLAPPASPMMPAKKETTAQPGPDDLRHHPSRELVASKFAEFLFHALG